MTDTTSPTGAQPEAQALAALSSHVRLRIEDMGLALAFIYALRSSLPANVRLDGPDPVVQLIGSPAFGQRLADYVRPGERGPALALVRLLQSRRALRDAIKDAGLQTSFLIFDCD